MQWLHERLVSVSSWGQLVQSSSQTHALHLVSRILINWSCFKALFTFPSNLRLSLHLAYILSCIKHSESPLTKISIQGTQKKSGILVKARETSLSFSQYSKKLQILSDIKQSLLSSCFVYNQGHLNLQNQCEAATDVHGVSLLHKNI